MKGRTIYVLIAALTVLLAAAPPALAQGGGASTTGTINGKVVDSSGAVLPGVTVTASSASLMGVQTSVTDASGMYRFPALPPGSYTLAFELPGFNTLKREAIEISMGFTATVNVELKVASLQETVTVTGESPVIDTSNTRVQQNFKLEALQEIPNARDMWSLLAVTPAVQMSRIDVGGNRAGTQTGYTAYGYSGQNRVLVEGINTTEGTAGAGFYFDYGSFEEVFLGTIAQGAEMPTPGVQSQFLGKSGGNRFQGEVYKDYERNSWQSDNISNHLPSKYLFNPTANASGIRLGSNELIDYNDFNLNIGGPIKHDKVWWYFSHRYQSNNVQQPNFIGDIAGKAFHTDLWNPSGKVTWQMNRNNRLIGYYQWGQKSQPNRLPDSSFQYASLAPTLKQTSGSWVYKGEWNSTLSNKLYAEARYGVFGYYFPLVTNTDTKDPQIINQQLNQYFNGDQKRQLDRHRGQATGAVTYFLDALGGTHSLKMGGEWLDEISYLGYLQRASGNIRETINANGTPVNVVLYAPTATALEHILSGPHGELLSDAKLTTWDAFITDQWTVGRASLNLGVRFDRYRSWIPEQKQLAFTFPSSLSIPDQTFAETTFLTWNAIAPRAGISYDLLGTGKTVLKVNYGLYRFNPGATLAEDANPNQAVKSVTYSWNDQRVCATCKPGDGIYQPGEEGTLTGSALAGAISVDPNLKEPYTSQATAYVEQQFGEAIGARAGFVWVGVRNQYGTMQPNRPASAYTEAFNFVDRGPDGTLGTADDRNLTFYGIPTSRISGCGATQTTPGPGCDFPANQVVVNRPNDGTYKTAEFSMTKRMSHRWSASGGFGYTWQHDFPVNYPGTPNGPFDYDYTFYSFKATGLYNFPWDVLVSASFRFQAGGNYARTLSPTAPSSCACTFSASRQGSPTNTTVYVSDYNDFRQDNISVLDLRVEKTIPIRRTKIRLFGDVYNVTNKYAAETISVGTGLSAYGVPTFQTPTAILGPRTGRIGFRFVW